MYVRTAVKLLHCRGWKQWCGVGAVEARVCEKLRSEFRGELQGAAAEGRAAFRLNTAVSKLVKTLSANKEATIRYTHEIVTAV
jgi:hypothetical protein